MEVNLDKIKEIIYKAGESFFNRKSAGHKKIKGIADYVTEVDITVQSEVRKMLYELYPAIQFMGEEESSKEFDFNSTLWILDPVDGTTNLIHDYQCSAISLALVCKKRVRLGIVYNPYNKEMFWAEEGKGCYLNGNPIHVSSSQTMEESLISIGTSPYYKEIAEDNFKIYQSIFIDCQDIRRSGSAAIDLAYAACGRTEAFFEKRLKIWDYAAGMLLIREAGGLVLDYHGNDAELNYVADIVGGTPVITNILTENYFNQH